MISLGFVLGVFPIVGFPTVLCLLASIGLRINIPALQLLNNISSPLQWALWLPLERVGARLFGAVAAKSATFAGKVELAAVHAVAGWALVCIPIGLLIYFAVMTVYRVRRSTGRA